MKYEIKKWIGALVMGCLVTILFYSFKTNVYVMGGSIIGVMFYFILDLRHKIKLIVKENKI